MTSTPVQLTVRIDPHKCVGSTMCIQYAPGVFALNADRQSSVINAAGEPAERLRAAAEQCPMEAIVLEDANTGERIFP
ncbi:MAG: ferredoxin [Phycisphaerales bacterium]|nr:ferredoxin [Phycisphaerales bacterium]